MQHDDVIWHVINHQFCSFKSKVARERTFCQNPYNVTGLCIRSACPLANSRYATIREEDGVCYLFIKTIERAHTPKNLWEKIKLPANYTKALELVSEQLEHFPKYLVHRNKQRLTKIHQMLIRMRKLRLKAKPKLVTTNTKVDRREVGKERKALRAAQLEKAIEAELLERLKQAADNEIYNFPETQFSSALSKASSKYKKVSGEKDIDPDEDEEEEVEEEEGEEESEREGKEAKSSSRSKRPGVAGADGDTDDLEGSSYGDLEEEEDEEEEDEEEGEYNVEYVEDFEESDDEAEADIEDFDELAAAASASHSLSSTSKLSTSEVGKRKRDSDSAAASSSSNSNNSSKSSSINSGAGVKKAPKQAKSMGKFGARVEIEYEEEDEEVQTQIGRAAERLTAANTRRNAAAINNNSSSRQRAGKGGGGADYNF